MAFKIPYLVTEPYLFFYVSSIILNAVIIPQLLLDNVCKRNFNATVCSNIYSKQFKQQQDQVQKESALWLTALYTSLSAINVFTLPILGPLADTIGTHRAMYLNPILSGIQSVVGIILTNLGQTFNTAFLLLAIPLVAFGGDYSGILMFCCSYISDTIPKKDRTFRINLLDGAYSLASALSALVSGFIIQRLGYTGGFVISLIVSVLNVIYLALFVPDPRKKPKSASVSLETVDLQSNSQNNLDETDEKEQASPDAYENFYVQNRDVAEIRTVESLGKGATLENCETITTGECGTVGDTQEKKSQKSLSQSLKNTAMCTDANSLINSASSSRIKTLKDVLKEANPYTNFRKLIQVVRAHNQSRAIIFLLMSSFSSLLTWTGEYSIIVLFVKNRPLNFRETDVGYFLAVQGIMWAVVGYLLLNYIFQRCFKCRDTLVITIALLFHGVYLIFLGLSTSKLTIYLTQLLCAVAALDIPAIRSSLTKRVDLGVYGTVLAGCATLEALGSLVGSLASTIIYAEFLNFHRGAAFFFITVFPILSSFFVGILYWKERRKQIQRDQVN